MWVPRLGGSPHTHPVVDVVAVLCSLSVCACVYLLVLKCCCALSVCASWCVHVWINADIVVRGERASDVYVYVC